MLVASAVSAASAERLDRHALVTRHNIVWNDPAGQIPQRGVNTGGPCPYLPGNGGLLYAVAMMAAGWDGAPRRNAPGFPDDGSWVVRLDGLKPAP